jgi:outer membrane protein assembly factor BamB
LLRDWRKNWDSPRRFFDRHYRSGWMVIALALLTLPATADDWTQWRGPNRSDISYEKGTLKDWPEGGPKQLWLFKDAGVGYSGFSVVGDTLYTMGSRDEFECLIALNVGDGTEKWSMSIGPRLENNWGDGPRDTPTVDGDYVYCMTAPGELACCRTEDGSIVWQAALTTDFGGQVPNWGYCESVLVDEGKVICTPGGEQGTMLALDKLTGEKIWQSKGITDNAHYSSAIVVVHDGRRQYIQLLMDKLIGVDAGTGEVIWSTPWVGKTAVIPTPIYHDGYVYISSGYNAGCKLVKIEGDKAVDVYENKTMKNHHGGVILVGDYLYGYSDNVGWLCQNFKTGENVWSDKEKLGKGCLTCVDGMLYLMSEIEGEVVLIEASPEGWHEHGRFVLEPKTTLRKPAGHIWTHPVVANGRLYLRDQELVFCFDVKAK